MLRRLLLPATVLAAATLAAAPAAAAPPRAVTLSGGWEVRTEQAAPAPPQAPPPVETEPELAASARPAARTRRWFAAQAPTDWQPTAVPSVFDARALPDLYAGSVRRYRLVFDGPETPAGFRWLIRFEQVRRSAVVRLNGRVIGRHGDPYTPFAVEARGLRPGRSNTLDVVVDGRKNPRLPEAWWNWIGIVRPVHLVPAGSAHVHDLGTMSRVRCSGPAAGCRAELLLDGRLERSSESAARHRAALRQAASLRKRGARERALRRAERLAPTLSVTLRAPGGRVTRETFELPLGTSVRRRLQLSLPVPAPQLWAPESPSLYAARIVLRDGGAVQQVERRRVGLRSVAVKGGRLYLNNRRIQLRGASIHEDMPGSGAALTPADMDRVVGDLLELGANVTRSHYALSEGLLSRLDRAGIMVWNQAPIWQRDRHRNILSRAGNQRRAWRTVEGTVIAARSHPSVITHSVANELWSRPDERPTITRRFLIGAEQRARDLDPTLPISVDINGRPGHPEQFTYHRFDMLGINQYYGWYPWVADFAELPLFLQELRDNYPQLALVMTEFGAEALPERAFDPIERKGSYAFQAMHVARTLDVLDAAPFSGGIYWTLREFEIYPGWGGGAGRRPAQLEPNTRHHKGLLTYAGDKKPAWFTVRDRYAAVPLYEAEPATAGAAQAPEDVTRLDRAIADLSAAKRDAAGEVQAQRTAVGRELGRCKDAGPGWERIRAVRHRPQRNLYASGARRLWSDLSAVAAERAALQVHRPAFERFLERLDRPLADPVLQAGIAAHRRRLAYYGDATAFATCDTFEALVGRVREFPHGTDKELVRLDYLSGRIYRRMIRYVPDKRRAAARRHGEADNGRRIAAASVRLKELGGNEGRANYLVFAFSLRF